MTSTPDINSFLQQGAFMDPTEMNGDSAKDETQPERNLLAAIMARAICDAFGTAYCDKHIIRNARNWILHKIQVRKPFSFGWVALHLDLDPVELQEKLRNMSSQEAAERIEILRT